MRALYTLDTSPLLNVRFADIFSQSVICICILFFTEWKVLSFLRSDLSAFLCVARAFDILSAFLTLEPRDCLLWEFFSPQSVMVLHFTSKSMIHSFKKFLNLIQKILKFIVYLFLIFYTALHSMWDLIPQPGIELTPPALGAGRLNHCTSREVPRDLFWVDLF